MQNGDIGDSQITASSSFDKQSVGPQNARLHSELASGAWCPKPQINSKSYEFLQVTFNDTFLITSVETQGRYGNGTGREFVSHYMIDYLRAGSQWIRYKNRTGHVLMNGNFDTTTPVIRVLDPPIVASRIRIVPASKSTRTVCMRAEVHGCKHDGVIYYSTVPDGSRLDTLDFKDNLFEDSQMYTESGIKRGLGLLTDGFVAQTSPFEKNHVNDSWIGWNRDTTDGHINILFEFEEVHNFTDVVLATFGNRIDQIDVIFSQDGKTFPLFSQISSSERQSVNNTSRRYDFRVPLHNRAGRKVRISIKFSSDWMFLTEVHFTSAANLTLMSEKIPTTQSAATQQLLVVCGIVFLTVFACVAYCISVCLKRRQKNKSVDSNVKKDLIITHMGNKPTCHVFPSNNKLSNGHYEVANDIVYARSQKSTLLSVSSKSSSSCRQIPPTWHDFNFPPPPEGREEHTYSQPVSPENSSNGSYRSVRKIPALKKYPTSALLIGKAIGEGKFTIIKECIIFGGLKCAHKSTKEKDCVHGTRAMGDEIACLLKCGRHQRIAEMYGVDESYNLLMEHVEYGCIRNFWLASAAPLDTEFLVRICKDVYLAMAFLESKRIVHGHFTPNNILLDSDFHAKICSPRGPSHHAQLRYSAPESIVNNEFTHKSDAWAVASTVYEMAYQCRQRPYEELTNEQIVDNACALLDHQPEAIVPMMPTVFSYEILQLLTRCFRVSQTDRPTFERLLKPFQD
ncbi:unnamed protein product [Caenorhabditis sp. 36 PRJEB53466]|nr:unnamed protein product [Caenorhabditis sp. 36 PRJEB53466]